MRKRWQRFSAEELRRLWEMWKEGRTYDEIGQTFSVGHNSVYTVVSKHGGLRPRDRTRSVRVLSLAEREEVSRSLASGESMRSVARQLGRAP